LNRTVALVAVFALFVIGVGVGMLATHIFYARELGRFGPAPGFGPRPFLTQLEHELGLSPEQRRRIEEIREESRIEADALHEELAPRVRAHMRRTEELIREVLTPEQRLAFDELQRRHRERADQFFLDGGPRHRPPPPPRRPPPPPRRGPPRPPSS
jgi:Spy/CpxP family protein refolding chaperone